MSLMTFSFQNRDYNFTRYPETSNTSLRAWSAADEYVLIKLGELGLSAKSTAIYNDRFGFLSCILNPQEPFVVIDRKSQQKSVGKNLEANNLNWKSGQWQSPLSELPGKVEVGIIGIPKTMDLFKLYLNHLVPSLAEDGVVLCSFMTKYFTPQMLSVAREFFEEVEQSLARKKSRLLMLKKKKPLQNGSLLNTISYAFDEHHTEDLKQYAGVFSGGNIDFATQFLIEHLKPDEEENTVLDLGAGNGVIARAIQLKKPNANIHLVDDSLLAIESSKLNLDTSNTEFHWNDTLEDFEDESVDLAVSNPPFHFGYETNIEVSIKLFQEVFEVLNTGGRFICVANQHLNYKTHLEKIFKTVKIIAQNEKYILYQSSK